MAPRESHGASARARAPGAVASDALEAVTEAEERVGGVERDVGTRGLHRVHRPRQIERELAAHRRPARQHAEQRGSAGAPVRGETDAERGEGREDRGTIEEDVYAALVGEGSTRGHPAHAAMRERYSRLREVFVAQLSEARTVGAVHPRRDGHGEAIRIAAVWDGLQLLQLYLPRRMDFAQRFAATIDHFTAVLRAAQRDGDLPPHRDPAREAMRLVALWDGLQYQWLYDRESVDVAAELAAHLDDILPRG
ncbi:hypothetical protein GCM10023065_03930 [Microbacterium laevaniformans]|uniref:TetR family transcriptional regulator C-terminal domain-containing protein n=1 Tax=Microbacterium laevaniformans TaxID=36807 RepID=UPI001D2527F8|nr:TetR family transcriptional regulator C-terminal domain-containing protein [Microbacterium laevaniformans]MBM7751347.1 hypothetical protein [Microbacterium laevaniformans]GLJ63507.1 hypothetical protein GCM10017578_03940 [Microbacterium laevaniformans]